MRIEREGLEHHRHAAAGDRLVGPSLPKISTRPWSGVTRPAMVRRVVVLPTELGPNSTKNRPSATLKDRFSSALHAAVRLAYVRQAQRAVFGLHHPTPQSLPPQRRPPAIPDRRSTLGRARRPVLWVSGQFLYKSLISRHGARLRVGEIRQRSNRARTIHHANAGKRRSRERSMCARMARSAPTSSPAESAARSVSCSLSASSVMRA